MNNIWKKIEYEFSLLKEPTKILLRIVICVLILFILYNIFLPLIKYHLPKDFTIEEYENIAGFIFIGLTFFSVVIYKILESIFKNHKK